MVPYDDETNEAPEVLPIRPVYILNITSIAYIIANIKNLPKIDILAMKHTVSPQ